MAGSDSAISIPKREPEQNSSMSSCDSIAQDLGFPDQDQELWWRATAHSLGRLLADYRYSKDDQLLHLEWYHKYILPALGPYPVRDQKPQFQPCPVSDGSACEHSINWREKGTRQTVRFTIEAVGPQAGTVADPFNQEAGERLLRRLAKDVPDVKLALFDHFAKDFFLPNDAAESLIPKMPPGTPLSQIWIAFDLLRGRLMAKVYFMPILKWIHTGVPTKTLVFDTARKINVAHGTFNASIELLDSFLESSPTGENPVMEMVAVDCIDHADSRIKFYLRTGVDTLAKAKHQLTLGGRLSGEVIEEGLEALSELWPILFRLEGDDIEDIAVLPAGSYCGCAVEMKPGRAEPETKLHMPVRKVKGTDAQLCDSLSSWFQRRGHSEFAATYKDNLTATL